MNKKEYFEFLKSLYYIDELFLENMNKLKNKLKDLSLLNDNINNLFKELEKQYSESKSVEDLDFIIYKKIIDEIEEIDFFKDTMFELEDFKKIYECFKYIPLYEEQNVNDLIDELLTYENNKNVINYLNNWKKIIKNNQDIILIKFNDLNYVELNTNNYKLFKKIKDIYSNYCDFKNRSIAVHLNSNINELLESLILELNDSELKNIIIKWNDIYKKEKTLVNISDDDIYNAYSKSYYLDKSVDNKVWNLILLIKMEREK